jgi:hypothetical protein
MDLFSCPRGHVFRAVSSEDLMPCPSAIGYDCVLGEVRMCPEIAHREVPRVDVLTTRVECDGELCACA